MKRFSCSGILLFFFIVMAIPSFSDGAITSGLSVREEYNDNINLDSTNRVDDLITTINPFINIDYVPSKYLSFNLDYDFKFIYYKYNSQYNRQSLDEIQELDLSNRLKISERLYVDISDKYTRVPVDERLQVTTDNIIVNMTDSNTFNVSPHMSLPLTPTLTAEVEYSYENQWYREGAAIDSEAHTYSLGLRKRLLPRIEGALKYSYWVYRPETSNATTVDAYDMQNASAELSYNVTSKLKVRAEMGEAWIDFENNEDRHTSFWEIDTDFTYNIWKSLSFQLNSGVSFGNSVDRGIHKQQFVDMYLTIDKATEIVVHPYYRHDEFLLSTQNETDEIIGAEINITRPLSKKLDITFGGMSERAKYLPGDDTVNSYRLGSGLEYRFTSHLKGDIGYTYYKRDSSDGTYDYYNNVVWLACELTF